MTSIITMGPSSLMSLLVMGLNNCFERLSSKAVDCSTRKERLSCSWFLSKSKGRTSVSDVCVIFFQFGSIL